MKRSILTGVFAGGWLLGLLCGAIVILYIPIYHRQGDELRDDARTICTEYRSGSTATAERISGPGLRVLIYTGDTLTYAAPASYAARPDLDALLLEDFPVLQTKREYFHIIPAQVTNRNPTQFWLVCGALAADGQTVAFLIKNLENVQEAFLGFLGFFTGFYWLCAAVLRLYFRRKRKLEEQQRIYIANVTHTLKAPIAAVRALTEALSDTVPPDSDQQRIYYGMILGETAAQARMVQEILELSKLQSMDKDVPMETVNPADVFAELTEKYEALCECAGVSLRISETAQRLPAFKSNYKMLMQIFTILLDNSLKFVDEGGEVVIDAALQKQKAVLSVQDSGVGIPKADIPHVFERFYQGGGTKNSGGSGLGLAIAKETAAVLREKIWVESIENRGATFFFTVTLL